MRIQLPLALSSGEKMLQAPLTLSLCSRKSPPLRPKHVVHLPEHGQAPVHPVRHGQHAGLPGLRHRHCEWRLGPASPRLPLIPATLAPRNPGSGLCHSWCQEALWVLALLVALWGRTLRGMLASSSCGVSLPPFPVSFACQSPEPHLTCFSGSGFHPPNPFLT